MQVLAHGIDLVAIDRIGRMAEEHGPRFLERVFTDLERHSAAQRKKSEEHLAGRFAVKEAVLKALGTGWGRGVAWTDVETVNSETGAPEVRLHARASELARAMGIQHWLVSISHTEERGIGFAVASVLAVGTRTG